MPLPTHDQFHVNAAEGWLALGNHLVEAIEAGEHDGHLAMLAFGTRSLSLACYAATRRFDAAFAHGSRSLMAAAGSLGLPVVGLADYEYTAGGQNTDIPATWR